MDEVQKAIENNTQHFMERGPALSYAYQSYVIARHPASNGILLGGLGAMGVGQMWFTEDEDHKNYPGYADAKIVEER